MKRRRARRSILPVSAALSTVAIVTPAQAHAASLQAVPAAFAARASATDGAQLYAAAEAMSQVKAVRAVREAVPDYTVRTGDTMSAVAARECGTAADWTGIYAASRAEHLTGPDANLIYPGQKLAVSCKQATIADPPAPVTSGYSQSDPHPASSGHIDASGKVYGVSYGDPYYCGDGDGDGYDVSCASIGRGYDQPGYSAPQQHSYSGSSGYSQPSGSYHGSGSMQSCIISRESGGNSQVMNSTGHYGLYQFSSQTWAAHGGNPADFGRASVAEQNQVYYNTVAQDGYSDWAPYDGC